MNKKKILKVGILLVVVLILVGGGIFWWQKDNIEDYLERKEKEGVVALAEDYIVVDSPDGKFLENKKDGLKVKIPDGWEGAVGMNMAGWVSDSLSTFYYPDLISRPPDGCIAEIEIGRLKNEKETNYFIKSVELVKREIEYYKEKGDSFPTQTDEDRKEITEVIEVSGIDSLKETTIMRVKGREDEIRSIRVEIPSEERVYFFNFSLFSEKCEQEVDKFLGAVSIN